MTTNAVTEEKLHRKFLTKIEDAGIDVHACYQCGRCSAGCPVTEFFDLGTMEVVRLAAYGMEGILLTSKTIWLCTACETCSARCPNSIDIAALMDLLRELALRKNVRPAEPRIAQFHHSFLGSVSHWGRAFEMGLIAGYKVRSGDITGDLKLGLRMLGKGKLSLRPHAIKGKSEIKEIFSGKGTEYER